MSEQLSFAMLDIEFGRAEARAWSEPATRRMKPWIGMLRGVASELADRYRQRDRDLYGQLMLIEEEVEAGRDSVAILERIGRAKGLLTVLFLALVLHSVWLSAGRGGEGLRRPPSGVRVVRRETLV